MQRPCRTSQPVPRHWWPSDLPLASSTAPRIALRLSRWIAAMTLSISKTQSWSISKPICANRSESKASLSMGSRAICFRSNWKMKIWGNGYNIWKHWRAKTHPWSRIKWRKKPAKLIGLSCCSTTKLMTWSSLCRGRKLRMSWSGCETKMLSSGLSLAILVRYRAVLIIKASSMAKRGRATMQRLLVSTASPSLCTIAAASLISERMTLNHRTSVDQCKTWRQRNKRQPTQMLLSSISTLWRCPPLNLIVRRTDRLPTHPIDRISEALAPRS